MPQPPLAFHRAQRATTAPIAFAFALFRRAASLLALAPLCLAASTPALAQNDPTPAQQNICNQRHLSNECYALTQEFAFKTLSQSGSTSLDTQYMDLAPFLAENVKTAYAEYTASQAYKDAVALARQDALQIISTELRVNQVGGNASAAGSTNLVTKPSTTDFLSIAAESGAFTDTLNGTTVSLQANADGLLKYFANRPVFTAWEGSHAHLLQPLNFTVTLNVSQSSSATLATSGSASSATPTLAQIAQIVVPSNNASFAAFTTTYQIYKKYNPEDPAFQTAWRSALAAHQPDLQSANNQIFAAVNTWLAPIQSKPLPPDVLAAQTQWHTLGKQAEDTADFDALVAAFEPYWKAVSAYVLSTTDDRKNLLAVNTAVLTYRAAAQDAITQARGAPLASLSYTYATPADKPATHAGRLNFAEVFAGGHKDPKTGKRDNTRTALTGVELTGNFGAEIYATLPTGAAYGRLRDVQLAAELDKPVGGTLTAPRATVSLAGYGQYQTDPTVLIIGAGNLAPGTNITLPADAQVLLGTAGWLGVVQGKVVINLSQGLSLPVAIKWSNKTDLLDANDIRGQVGLSYDLSALSKLLQGAK